MRDSVNIGLVGDYNASVPAHQAISLALQRAASALQITLFQPERAALKGNPAPLVVAFIRACAS
jgi:CTP synthase (UTP-ammonia lyase)